MRTAGKALQRWLLTLLSGRPSLACASFALASALAFFALAVSALALSRSAGLLRGGGGGGGDVEQRADLGDGGWMLRALSPAGEAAQAGFVRASAEGRFLVFLAAAF